MIKYDDLIGKPYEVLGRGPDKYDCYGLIMEMYRRHNKTTPDYNSPIEFSEVSDEIQKQLLNWHLIEKEEATRTIIGYNNKEFYLRPNCAIILRIGRFGCHIGYVLDNNKFIHTWEKSGGVVVERIDFWKNHILGFYDYVK